MRIAYVYDAVYPDISGGVERRIWELSKRLAARGHEVHIFGMHLWDGNAVILRDGVTLHGICRPFSFYREGKRRIFPAFCFGLKAFLALTRERFDIVDCQQFPYMPALASIVACRISGSPVVITWHEVWGDYWYEYLGFRGAAGKFLERLLARYSVHPIAVSETTKNDLQNLIPDLKIEVITNGIDLAEINSVSPSATKSDLIFVGRLIKEKHVDVLIDAVVILKDLYPDIQCLIIGGGPERYSLETMVNKRGISDNITFTGFLGDSRDVIGHMKSSRIFVLPSTREGFGIAALEALACNVPIVTIDHPKNASMVFTKENCGLLSTLDPVDLASKIEEGLAAEKVRSNECILKAGEYNWEKIITAVEDFYMAL